MGIEIGGIFGLLILILDIWAIVNIAQSGTSTASKVLWILLVLILPGCPILLYPLLWVLMPKESDGDVQSPVTPSTA